MTEAQPNELRLEIERLRAENMALRVRLGDREDDPGRDHEAMHRAIVESFVDDAVIATDLTGRVTMANEAALNIFRFEADDLTGKPIDTIFTAEDRASGRPQEELRQARENGRAADNRWHLRADGTRFFAHGAMVPLRAEAGAHLGYVKVLRDRTAEEEARMELVANRERLQLALDASALVGTWDWDVPGDRVYADTRFAGLYGLDPAEAANGLPIARYLGGILPEDVASAGAAIERALADGSVYAQEYRTVNGAGEVRWVFARGRCFHDGDGRPVRFPGAVVDITREKRREERQAALLALGDDGSAIGEPVDYTLRALRILGETLGIGRVGYASLDASQSYATVIGEWTHAAVAQLAGPLPLANFGSGLLDALRTGLVVVEDVATDPSTRDGLDAWAAIEVRSLLNMSVVENGQVRVILYLHCKQPRCWTEEELAFVREILNRAWAFSRRRRDEQTLVEAELRLRMAHEAAAIGSFDHDLRSGTMVWDRMCRDAFGVGDDDAVSFEATFKPLLHPEDRNRVLTELERARDVRGGGRLELVFRAIGRDDGTQRTLRVSGQHLVENGVAVRLVGSVRDVTAEKEAENRQILLTRELQHRVKNTLAMVNALANQTLRRASNAQEGLAAFSARLIALSHAHDILTQTSWTSAPIGAVVAESLATHRGDGERVRWSGPDVRLTAKQSLALALALHELATNAVKYGALSNEAGRVDVSWHIALREGRPHLRFDWRETGGPPVVAPTRRGFGSRLIEQSLAAEFGGVVDVGYASTGLVCTIDAPLQFDVDEDAILPAGLGDLADL